MSAVKIPIFLEKLKREKSIILPAYHTWWCPGNSCDHKENIGIGEKGGIDGIVMRLTLWLCFADLVVIWTSYSKAFVNIWIDLVVKTSSSILAFVVSSCPARTRIEPDFLKLFKMCCLICLFFSFSERKTSFLCFAPRSTRTRIKPDLKCSFNFNICLCFAPLNWNQNQPIFCLYVFFSHYNFVRFLRNKAMV